MIEETLFVVALAMCVGFLATVTMDVLGSVCRRVGLTVGVKGPWVGRWYLGIAKGQFAHADIAAAPEQPGEMKAAMVGHYVIGIVLAVFYVVGAGMVGVSPSSLPAAVGYGLATCVFPWFLMFPALGFGWFGVRGPPELRIFTTSVINHILYGLGLWWSAWVLPLD